MLSLYHRGRLWDGRTGSILDVQTVGREIWERNNPLVSCGGDEIPIPPEIVEIIRSCVIEVENEDDMACQGAEPPIKIENGILYYWWCCAWQAIGSLPGAAPEDVIDPFAAVDPAPTYSACSKAKAIVDVIYGVADVVWENQLETPWTWVGTVEDYVVGHNDLDDNQIISAFLVAITLNAIYEYTDIFDPVDRQQFLCFVASLLDDTAAGITRDQWDDMIGGLGAIYGEGIDDFFRACADAIGPSDMREITVLQSIDAGYDCSCPPDGIPDPTGGWLGYDWIHYFDFSLTQSPGVIVGALTVWEQGSGFVDWAHQSTLYAKTAFKVPVLNEGGAGHIKRLWWTLEIGNGFNFSGDAQRIDAANATLAGPYSPGGDPVSLGGRITSEIGLDYTVSTGTNDLTCIIEGHIQTPASGPKDSRSPKWLALAVAGTGVDPFVAA
jgi:hypothetical protein